MKDSLGGVTTCGLLSNFYATLASLPCNLDIWSSFSALLNRSICKNLLDENAVQPLAKPKPLKQIKEIKAFFFGADANDENYLHFFVDLFRFGGRL